MQKLCGCLVDDVDFVNVMQKQRVSNIAIVKVTIGCARKTYVFRHRRCFQENSLQSFPVESGRLAGRGECAERFCQLRPSKAEIVVATIANSRRFGQCTLDFSEPKADSLLI